MPIRTPRPSHHPVPQSVRWEHATAVGVSDVDRHVVRIGPEPGQAWEVSVAVPAGYGDDALPRPPRPVLYLTDGWYTFPIATEIVRATSPFSLGQLRPLVVVGIRPATDDLDALVAQHIRDLTPTPTMPAHLARRAAFGAGGASAMLTLIRDVIAPHLESKYGLDPDDRGLGGISLAGMFASWSLLTRPSGFRRFLAVSPSVYWDDELVLDDQRLPAVVAEPRDVYLAVGEREDGPDRQWPTMRKAIQDDTPRIDLVKGVRRLEARLEHLPTTSVHTDIIAGEQHTTVWPSAFTRGLVHLYGTA
jgi:uncharacterized protein